MSSIPRDLDDVDKLVLGAAYELMGKACPSRVTGSRIFELACSLLTEGISPPLVSSRIQRLVRKGLLANDVANSNNSTKLYLPTANGQRAFDEMNQLG